MSITVSDGASQAPAPKGEIPDVREALWRSMLDAELNKKYWKIILERYSWRDTFSKIFLAVTSSGTVAAWVAQMQTVTSAINFDFLWKFLSGISALLAVSLPVLDWQRRIKEASSLYSGWNARYTSYNIVYHQFKELSDAAISKEFEKAKTDEKTLEDVAGSFRSDDKLKEKIRSQIKSRIEWAAKSLSN